VIRMPPVLSFVGPHNVGKTTIMEQVIGRLTDMGYRTGLIKHSARNFTLDVPGKDTFRLAKAGAEQIVLASSNQIACYRQIEEEPEPESLLSLFTDEIDIILVEGYKRAGFPKIEIARREVCSELLCPENLIALVTDLPVERKDIPIFRFDEIEALTLFIKTRFFN